MIEPPDLGQMLLDLMPVDDEIMQRPPPHFAIDLRRLVRSAIPGNESQEMGRFFGRQEHILDTVPLRPELLRV